MMRFPIAVAFSAGAAIAIAATVLSLPVWAEGETKAPETTAPADPVVKPADPVAKPAESSEKPAETTDKPAEPPAQPETKDEPPPATDEAAPDAAGEGEPSDVPPDSMSFDDVPVVEVVELTADSAKHAVDAFALVKDKYKDAKFEDYDTLQGFADLAPEGKTFEADIKALGFVSVDEWYKTVTTVGFAYAAVTDDQSGDINQQIEEIKLDTEIPQDMKDRMTASLKAMIPSDNNRKIVEALVADPAYTEKLKLLSAEEE